MTTSHKADKKGGEYSMKMKKIGKQWLTLILTAVILLSELPSQTTYAATSSTGVARPGYAPIVSSTFIGKNFDECMGYAGEAKNQTFMSAVAAEAGIDEAQQQSWLYIHHDFPSYADSRKYGKDSVYQRIECYTEVAPLYSFQIIVGRDSRILDFYKGYYDANGYDFEGYDKNGFDNKGYNREGYDQEGFDKNGYDIDGYGRDGFNAKGYDDDGYNRAGYNKEGYNRAGYKKNGLDRNGRTKVQNSIKKYKATKRATASVNKGYVANTRMYTGYKLCGAVERAIRDKVLLEKNHYSNTSKISISKPTKKTIKNGQSKKYKGNITVYTYKVRGTSKSCYTISIICDSNKRIIDGCYASAVKINGKTTTRTADAKGYDLYGYSKDGYDKSGYNKSGLKSDGRTILVQLKGTKSNKITKKTSCVNVKFASTKTQYYKISITGISSKVKAIVYNGDDDLTGRVKAKTSTGTSTSQFTQAAMVNKGKCTLYIKGTKSLTAFKLNMKNASGKAQTISGCKITIAPVSKNTVKKKSTVKVSAVDMISYAGEKTTFQITATEPVDITSSYPDRTGADLYALFEHPIGGCITQVKNGTVSSSIAVFSPTLESEFKIWPWYKDKVTYTITGRYSGKKQTVKILALPSRALVADALADGIDLVHSIELW